MVDAVRLTKKYLNAHLLLPIPTSYVFSIGLWDCGAYAEGRDAHIEHHSGTVISSVIAPLHVLAPPKKYSPEE